MADDGTEAMLAAALAEGEAEVERGGRPKKSAWAQAEAAALKADETPPHPLDPEAPSYDGPGKEDPYETPLDISDKDVAALRNMMAEDDEELDDVAKNIEAMLIEEESLVSPDEPVVEEQPVDPAVTRDLEKARTALRRDGWTDEELDGLTADSVLNKGKRTRELEADRDRLRQRLDLLEDGKEGTRGTDSAAKTVEQPLDTSELTSLLASELGEEVSGPFKAYLASVEERHGKLEKMLGNLLEQQTGSAEASERQRVGERFPDLLDDVVYAEKVKPEMNELAELPRYKGKGLAMFPELLEKAALLAGLKEVDPAAEAIASEARSQATRQKKAGAVTGPGQNRQSLSKVPIEKLEGESIRVLNKFGVNSREFKTLSKELRRRREAG